MFPETQDIPDIPKLHKLIMFADQMADELEHICSIANVQSAKVLAMEYWAFREDKDDLSGTGETPEVPEVSESSPSEQTDTSVPVHAEGLDGV